MPSPEKETLAKGSKKYNWVYAPNRGKVAKIIHPDQNPTQKGQLNKERNNGSLDK